MFIVLRIHLIRRDKPCHACDKPCHPKKKFDSLVDLLGYPIIFTSVSSRAKARVAAQTTRQIKAAWRCPRPVVAVAAIERTLFSILWTSLAGGTGSAEHGGRSNQNLPLPSPRERNTDRNQNSGRWSRPGIHQRRNQSHEPPLTALR